MAGYYAELNEVDILMNEMLDKLNLNLNKTNLFPSEDIFRVIVLGKTPTNPAPDKLFNSWATLPIPSMFRIAMARSRLYQFQFMSLLKANSFRMFYSIWFTIMAYTGNRYLR